MNLSGKAFLITGASRGIGRSIADIIADAGGMVALTARSADDLQAVASAIESRGGRAIALPADAADASAIAQVVADTAQAFGRLDGLINNAGIIDPIQRIEAADAEEWARILNINVVGPTIFTRHALPHLRKTHGAVVAVSSGAAHGPQEGWAAYCASKAALWMVTMALHLEEGDAIDVYGASPGTVDTDMQALIRASGVNPISRIPRGDLAPPSLPAQGIVWLLSERPDDLRGQDVRVRDAAFLARAGIQ